MATVPRSGRGCLPGTSWILVLLETSTDYVVVVMAPLLKPLLEGLQQVMVPPGNRDCPRYFVTQVCLIISLFPL